MKEIIKLIEELKKNYNTSQHDFIYNEIDKISKLLDVNKAIIQDMQCCGNCYYRENKSESCLIQTTKKMYSCNTCLNWKSDNFDIKDRLNFKL